MADMKATYQHFKATFGAKPFIPSEVKGTAPEAVPHEPSYGTSGAAEDPPLKLGPMGILTTGRIFDMKIAGQSDLQFSS